MHNTDAGLNTVLLKVTFFAIDVLAVELLAIIADTCVKASTLAEFIVMEQSNTVALGV